ncbi:hypothetical protein Tco_0450717 [Tanacetum coccineum]
MDDEYKLLSQKAMINWIKDGDKNTAFFHKVVKGRKHRSKIESICDDNGVRYFGDDVPGQFLTCLLKEQLLEPALNLTVHCCGREFRVLNGYDQKSFDEERGLNCIEQTSFEH